MNARRGLLAAGLAVAPLAAACGGRAPLAAQPAPRSPAASAVSEKGARSPSGPADAVASLDALATRGATEAPLMRELARVDRAAPRSPDVRAERDLCVRAAFAASQPVTISFADATHATRGDVANAASGMVPPRGPACVRKGDALHLVVEGAPETVVRAVIFGAP